MRKLAEVEDAKELMNAALDWSLFTWLWEKKSVRATADQANSALDRLNKKTKTTWSDELKAAYHELVEESGGGRRKPKPTNQSAAAIDPQVRLLAKKVKDADDDAHRARMDAEETFDEADRLLSVSTAREGCHKAIRSWELHEKAIRKAEAAQETSTSKGHN
jgi:hypothetical protein